MSRFIDKIHPLGMSDNGSTFLSVEIFADSGNNISRFEPPLNIVLEGEDARVAITQGGLAARYKHDELSQIGDGNSFLGIKRVIGYIAHNGNLVDGVTKPLHPTLFDAAVVETRSELLQPPKAIEATSVEIEQSKERKAIVDWLISGQGVFHTLFTAPIKGAVQGSEGHSVKLICENGQSRNARGEFSTSTEMLISKMSESCPRHSYGEELRARLLRYTHADNDNPQYNGTVFGLTSRDPRSEDDRPGSHTTHLLFLPSKSTKEAELIEADPTILFDVFLGTFGDPLNLKEEYELQLTDPRLYEVRIDRY